MEDLMRQEKQQLQLDILAAKRQLSELREALLRTSVQRDLQENNRYLSHLSICDRALFAARLGQDISRAQRDKRMVAVLTFHLEPYRQIRDEYGQALAGLLLRTAAERLKLHARASDTVGYMGEEEFSLVMPDLDSAQAAADFAARLTESFIKTPVQLGDRDVFIHVLIGIALYPLDGLDAEILLNHAQLALSHAKDFGSMQYYSARMSDTALQGLTLEDVMQRAFECGEFVVHYVPKVCLSDGKVDGMEALLYWQSPERGMVAPREFVPQLEKMGLIVPVGAWLLETVCRQIAHWQQTRCAVSTVSINVSALELFQDDLAGLVLRALQRHGLMQHAGILEFELSEHLLMSDMVAVSGALKALKEIGVAICIEDFGTGHSCLNYLKYLPVDTLKIDQTFIRNLPHSREDAAIVSAIITLGLGLGLQVVAAGVETAGQLDWLRDAGCLVAQGSLIGPAVLPAPTGDEG